MKETKLIPVTEALRNGLTLVASETVLYQGSRWAPRPVLYLCGYSHDACVVRTDKGQDRIKQHKHLLCQA